LRKER
jgi:hypothetical protein